MFDWLIPAAHAMAAPQNAGQPSGMQQYSGIFMMVIIFGIFYMLIIRPQKKKQQEHKTMLDNLKKGDKVLTSGGIYGEVFALTPDALTLVISEGVKVKVARGYIAGLASGEHQPEE